MPCHLASTIPRQRFIELLRQSAGIVDQRVDHRFGILGGQSSPIAYTGSPLNAPPEDTWGAGPAPGAVLPECPLTVVRDGVESLLHMTDLLGAGFTVFQFGAGSVHMEGVTVVKLARRRAADPSVPLRLRPQRPAVRLVQRRGGRRLPGAPGRPRGRTLSRTDGSHRAGRHRPRAAPANGHERK